MKNIKDNKYLAFIAVDSTVILHKIDTKTVDLEKLLGKRDTNKYGVVYCPNKSVQ